MKFLVGFALLSVYGCTGNGEIPAPAELENNTMPITTPLQFAGQSKLLWDTIHNGGIHPIVKAFDLEQLPATPLVTTTYEPIRPIPPELSKEYTFNYDSLPTQPLNIDALKKHPIAFTSRKLSITNKIKVQAAEQNTRPFSIHSFTTAQGFPSLATTVVFQDKAGMIWIGAADGLFRYDGQYVETIFKGQNAAIAGINEDNFGNIWFVQYGSIGMIDLHRNTLNMSANAGSLPNNLGLITKDSGGRLWLNSAQSRGMIIVDPATLTFQKLNEKNTIADTAAYQVIEDNQHRMWISTFTSGIYIVDLQKKKLSSLNLFQYYKYAYLSALEKDERGNIWVSNVKGSIYQLDIKKGTINQRVRGDSTVNFVFGMKRDVGGRFWLQTSNGAKIVDLHNGTYKRFATGEGLASNNNYSFLLDNKKNIWLTTDQGISIISQRGEPTNYLPNEPIISMMEDADEHLWVGTRDGLKILDFKEGLVRSLDFTKELGSGFVQSFYQTPEGLIIATNGGVSYVDMKSNRISYIGKKQGLLKDTVYVTFKDSQKNLWVSGPESGIYKIDSSGKNLLFTNNQNGLNDVTIQDIKQDNSGQIWIATSKGGINVYNPATGIVKYLNNLPGLQTTPVNHLLLSDAFGRIWIGTNEGVYVADAKAGTITNINTRHGLANNLVVSLLPYKNSVVVGTSKLSSVITAPVPVYAGGKPENAGKWEIAPVAYSNGFSRRNKGAWSTDAVSKSGRYFIGDVGIKVINTVEPVKESGTTHITGLTIMGQPYLFTNKPTFKESDTLYDKDTFYLKGQNAMRDEAQNAGLQWDSVAGPYNLPLGLRIHHNQNYLQFQFAQTNFIQKDSVWFMYVLEGVDKKWNGPTSNTFSENYLNLSPGSYTFKVSGKGPNGKWDKPVSYSFTITPPWYKTWWAYTLFALAAIALLRAYVVYRSRRLEKEKKLLEVKVAQRTEELNQSLESLKQTQAQLVQSEKMASLGELTAGIAHEIQNPLNFVNNFSDVSKELLEEMEEEMQKGDMEEALAIANDIKDNLGKIAHHGRRADSIVKGMLQHSRSSTGTKEQVDINALVDEYQRLSYHGLRAKDKSFNAKLETSYDESIGKIAVLPQELGRVFLNLLNNAFYSVTEKRKTAGNTYQPTVNISTQKTDGKVRITVQDNGIGIPQKVLDKIYQPFFTTKPTGEGTGLGLSLSYDIITKGHGGEMKVESEEGEGAAFIITLPTALS